MSTSDAVFIVDSPFQGLCALSAIAHYNIDKPIFVLYNQSISKTKTYSLIENSGEVIFVDFHNDGTLKLIKAIREVLNRSFSTIFVGDYFSYCQYVMAIALSRINTRIIYLDDGNSTLEIGPPINRIRGNNRNEKLLFKFFLTLSKFFFIKEILFTIFKLGGSCPLRMEFNRFLLPCFSYQDIPKGVFVIGTNSSQIELLKYSYDDYLFFLDKYIKINYKDEDVFYCPHRRDLNNKASVVSTLGWHLFDTKISVEVDFAQKGVYPRAIIGFGSTALLTLKSIYKEIDVINVTMNYASSADNASYETIGRYYERQGIVTINIME